jgi:hypothetical protein
MVKILRSPLALAALALSSVVSAEDLCSITPSSYSGANTTYPHLAAAFETLEQYSIAAWYTDRLSTTDRTTMLDDITSQCSEDSRMTIAVYGIPDKDCNAGLSSSGTGTQHHRLDHEQRVERWQVVVPRDNLVAHAGEPSRIALGCSL